MLRVEDLSISFVGQPAGAEAVRHVQFDLSAGEILGIVGESGSGKTLTALAIAGLLRRRDITASGKILFEGTDLLSLDRQALRTYQGKEIGIVFQEPMTSLNPAIKIGRQVEESLRIHTSDNRTTRREKALQAMASAELPDPEALYHKYPHQLSGGMRQRVMIAAAIVLEPKLLIADEPTTALDVTIQAQILRLLTRLNREMDMGILFISHDLTVVSRLCNRVIVMQGGEVVEKGDIHSIFHHPQTAYTKALIAAMPGEGAAHDG